MTKEQNNLPRKGAYFRQSFVFILFISCLPVLFIGGGIYMLSIGKVEKELQASHEKQVERQVDRLHEKVDSMELLVSQLAFDTDMTNSFTHERLEKEFRSTYQLSKLLFMIKDQQPLLSEASLFIDGNVPLLLSPEYSRLSSVAELQEYRSLLEANEDIYWKDTGIAPPILIQLIRSSEDEPSGAYVFKMNQKEIARLLQDLSRYDAGDAFILNEKKEVIFHSGQKKKSTFESFLQESISAQGKNEGSFRTEWKGSMYSVTYGEMKRLHQRWTYVSAAPLTSITAPLITISKFIVVLIVICLITAIILTWYVSKRMYRPIQQFIRLLTGDEKQLFSSHIRDEFQWFAAKWTDLSSESTELQQQMTSQRPHFQQNLLRQLIGGKLNDLPLSHLQEKMKRAGFAFEGMNTIIDLQATGSFLKRSDFTQKDEQLAIFMMKNVFESILCEKGTQLVVLDQGRWSLTGLVTNASIFAQELEVATTDLANWLKQYTGLSLTMTISDPTHDLREIPQLFEWVKKHKQNRRFKNEQQIIRAHKNAKEREEVVFDYPFELENSLIQSLQQENEQAILQDVSNLMCELSKEAKENAYVHPCLMQLVSRIQKEMVQCGVYPPELFTDRNLFSEILDLHDPNQAEEWLMSRVLTPYVIMLAKRKNKSQTLLVERVRQTLHERYMEDISLEICADQEGTSTYTLSKAFKQVTEKNFIEYLTALRIEKAKELLLHTDKKIHDVSEEVGYRHSYFNRIFKKQVGMPPGVYRQTHQHTASKLS
ncbi:AraC family transcriptional regulator [Bacillus sp. NPDC077027]|uniref:AraC family transcriptional regulator n=1 Tax=Bacillus sp. NPDC077027 TaxID=3390548 RepID=UPI003D01E119